MKIRTRKQRTDVDKFSFANRTIRNWNQLPAGVLETFTVNWTCLERGLGMELHTGEL